MDFAELALAAARAGAAGIAATTSPRVTTKAHPGDFVTDADLASERAILQTLRAERPDDAILAEESGDHAGGSGVHWHVDPLDGTANFVFGRPDYAVAVAANDDDGPLAGALVRPAYRDWLAARPDSAYGPDGPVRVRSTRRLAESMVTVTIGGERGARERNFGLLGRLLPLIRDFRRSGSSSCDFFQVATGQLDALVSIEAMPWDVHPGLNVVLAAGGVGHVVALPDGRVAVVAGAPAAADELAAAVRRLA